MFFTITNITERRNYQGSNELKQRIYYHLLSLHYHKTHPDLPVIRKGENAASTTTNFRENWLLKDTFNIQFSRKSVAFGYVVYLDL